MTPWKDETSLTTVSDLSKEFPSEPSRHHDPSLSGIEAEILEHYKEFAYFCNKLCKDDPDAGKRFYDLDEAMYFDLMGTIQRPGFRSHYDKITPYLSDAQIAFKDIEVVAVTETFGYVTAVQRYWGTAADGNAFDFTFRTTSLVRKIDGVWKYIHEHFSFPVDMATKVANMTGGVEDVEKSMRLEK
ncbi:hypothetical protein IQ07DRAFT_679746 [Pyrenochaeta sp. DS3sAY3a]|nr:hypothetical protein IQ07DRAFT_679746 [Pyrenochaeta sp. DS3sAY3a]